MEVIVNVGFIIQTPPGFITEGLNLIKAFNASVSHYQGTGQELTNHPMQLLTWWIGNALNSPSSRTYIDYHIEPIPFGVEYTLNDLFSDYTDDIRKTLYIPQGFPDFFSIEILNYSEVLIMGLEHGTIQHNYPVTSNRFPIRGNCSVPY